MLQGLRLAYAASAVVMVTWNRDHGSQAGFCIWAYHRCCACMRPSLLHDTMISGLVDNFAHMQRKAADCNCTDHLQSGMAATQVLSCCACVLHMFKQHQPKQGHCRVLHLQYMGAACNPHSLVVDAFIACALPPHAWQSALLNKLSLLHAV